jgi:hypothetical protein
MRGDDVQQQAMFSYLSPEVRVPQDHPLRPIRKMVNQALAKLSGEFPGYVFPGGSPFHRPRKAAVRLVAPGPFTIRSERDGPRDIAFDIGHQGVDHSPTPPGNGKTEWPDIIDGCADHLP